MSQFFLWISVLTPISEPIIRKKLISLGYTLHVANGNGNFIYGNCICYRITYANKDVKEARAEIENFLLSKIKFHFFLISEVCHDTTRWCPTNISFDNVPSMKNKQEDELSLIDNAISKPIDDVISYMNNLIHKNNDVIRERRDNFEM